MFLRLCVFTFVALVGLLRCARGDEIADRIEQARAALKSGDPAAAQQAAAKVIELAPDRPAGYFLRGEALGMQRQSAEALKDFNKVLALDPKYAVAYDRRGSERFKLGQIKESIEDFDKYIELQPKAEESHWKRGISYYYAGRFADGAKQFELGKKVYGDDVENAFWHYLCNARLIGVDKARQQLLKVGLDRRIPMMKVYDLIQGKVKPEEVLQTAENAKLAADDKTEALFYAHLYVALNYEAEGDANQALAHMKKAHEHKIGHYMWDVADVDLLLAKKKGL